MSETEVLFAANILVGVLLAAGGWWMKNMWEMIRELQKANNSMAVKLAEGYVPRAEWEKMSERMFASLEDIRKEVSHLARNIPLRSKP